LNRGRQRAYYFGGRGAAKDLAEQPGKHGHYRDYQENAVRHWAARERLYPDSLPLELSCLGSVPSITGAQQTELGKPDSQTCVFKSFQQPLLNPTRSGCGP